MNELHLLWGITDEQILFLAKEAHTFSKKQEIKDIAIKIFVNRVILDFMKENKLDFTEEDIEEAIGMMLLEHIMTDLSLDGLIEEDLDNPGLFRITEEGRKLVNKGGFDV